MMMLFRGAGEDGGVGMEVARKTRGTSGQLLGGGGRCGWTGGMMRSSMDPHMVLWMRDVEVLLWATSSGKRLRLGGGRRRVWGFAGFHALGV